MVRSLLIPVCCACAVAWGDPADEQSALESFFDEHVTFHHSYTAIFDTHPPTGENNTGNLFNFVPHGHLVGRHSLTGPTFEFGDKEPDEPGDTTALISMKFLISGVFAEDESGESHHIIAKVVDRNIIEPVLRKVFRRKAGEALVHALDVTLVDRVSDRAASEILSRIPVTASVREFMVQIGRVLDEDRRLTVRAGLFQPSFGAPRDATGRTRLDDKMISGPEVQYTMTYPSHTLAAEVAYLIQLNGKQGIRVTGGIQQGQDPDATLAQVFRNAVFDEGATELSVEKVDTLYVQAVYFGEGFEVYGSLTDIEGVSVAGGIYYELAPGTAVSLDAAYHEPETAGLTPLEKAAETDYRRGLSLTLLHDFTPRLTGYVNAERLTGAIGKRVDLSTERIEAGLVYRTTKSTRVGLSVYRREREDRERRVDTGFRLSFRVKFSSQDWRDWRRSSRMREPWGRGAVEERSNHE